MGVWLVMIAQLSYTRSRKSTPKRAVTSQENRLLNAVITGSTVALWHIDCHRRASPSHTGRACGDCSHLFPDGYFGLGVRSAARAPRPPVRRQDRKSTRL